MRLGNTIGMPLGVFLLVPLPPFFWNALNVFLLVPLPPFFWNALGCFSTCPRLILPITLANNIENTQPITPRWWLYRTYVHSYFRWTSRKTPKGIQRILVRKYCSSSRDFLFFYSFFFCFLNHWQISKRRYYSHLLYRRAINSPRLKSVYSASYAYIYTSLPFPSLRY